MQNKRNIKKLREKKTFPTVHPSEKEYTSVNHLGKQYVAIPALVYCLG